MLGTAVKCPLVVKNKFGDDVVCAYQGYQLIKQGLFTQSSGFDPLACKVRCRRCGGVYIVFPPPDFKEAQDD